MVELFANSGDPDDPFWDVWSGSALFASYPFRGLQSSVGQDKHDKEDVKTFTLNTKKLKRCLVLYVNKLPV